MNRSGRSLIRVDPMCRCILEGRPHSPCSRAREDHRSMASKRATIVSGMPSSSCRRSTIHRDGEARSRGVRGDDAKRRMKEVGKGVDKEVGAPVVVPLHAATRYGAGEMIEVMKFRLTSGERALGKQGAWSVWMRNGRARVGDPVDLDLNESLRYGRCS